MKGFSGHDDWSGGVRFEPLANLAHELRTPVQVLLGYLDILRDDRSSAGVKLSDTNYATIIERMKANALELAQTVENLLEFALANTGAETTLKEEIDLAEFFGELHEVLTAANAKPKVAFRINLDDAPRSVTALRRALRSMVLNLAINALKFTSEGAVSISVSRGAEDSETLEIEIRDTGAGISNDLLSSVFEPLIQLSKSSSRSYRGLGLGLTVVQRNVNNLGGRLQVESMLGVGTCFKVTIPCTRSVPRVCTLSHSGSNLAY